MNENTTAIKWVTKRGNDCVGYDITTGAKVCAIIETRGGFFLIANGRSEACHATLEAAKQSAQWLKEQTELAA